MIKKLRRKLVLVLMCVELAFVIEKVCRIFTILPQFSYFSFISATRRMLCINLSFLSLL